MKHFIILILFSIFIISCENPVISPVTDKCNDTDTLTFQLYQNYGYCDSTGCHTENILLLQGMVSGECYSVEYSTGRDSIYAYGQYIYYTNCYFIYETTGDKTFSVDNGYEVNLVNGMGYLEFDLNCNTKYFLTIY